jgi:hypothetical protein
MGVEAFRVRTVGRAMVLALRQACEKEPNTVLETMRRKSRTAGGWTRLQTSPESAARAEDLPHSRISAASKVSHIFFHPPIQLSSFIFFLSVLAV